MNEVIAAVLIGMLLSVSAGVRITIPLLVVNVLAFEHVIRLPHDLAWLGTGPTLVLLSVAFVAETLVHFIPAAGTFLKAAVTPLAFVAGTLLMAVPLGNENPLYRWILAGALGGGLATFTHLGFTGLRAATGPVNLASGGTFGIGWNLLELFVSIAFIALSGICIAAGWVVALSLLAVLGIAVAILIRVLVLRWAAWRQSNSNLFRSSAGLF